MESHDSTESFELTDPSESTSSTELTLARMNQVLSVVIGVLMFGAVCVVGFQYGPTASRWIKDYRRPREFQAAPSMSGFVTSSPIPTTFTEFRPVNIQPISEQQMREIGGIMGQNMARDAMRQSQIPHSYRP
jgi:hypothetical protein